MAKPKKQKIFNPYQNIPYIPLQQPNSERFGKMSYREFQEIQVGASDKTSIAFPQIMRANRQGLWLGYHIFGDAFDNPSPQGITAPFRVDMAGNVIAQTLQTSLVGQRVQLIDDVINFYADDNTLSGSIFADPGFLSFNLSNPTSSYAFSRGGITDFVLGIGAFPDILINTAGGKLRIRDGGVVFMTQLAELYADGLGSITTNGVFSLFESASAPTFGGVRDGSMYYDTTLGKARVREGGTWQNIV